MDERENLILVHGENKTQKIKSCRYNPKTRRYDVTFLDGDGETYHYGCNSIVCLKDPQTLDPVHYRIKSKKSGKWLSNIQSIFSFGGYDGYEEYWYIVFKNGFSWTYLRSELEVIVSCLIETKASDRLAYLRELSAINDLKGKDGEALLEKKYDSLAFVSEESALAVYLYPEKYKIRTNACNPVIFPFGGNASQFKAVRSALKNQMSVIQGPPGTGKTQTILNIIANLLIQGKTMEIVSSNNSATENVLEKLALPKYGLKFLAAPLGKEDKKDDFIKSQSKHYPDLSSWERPPEAIQQLREKAAALAQELTDCFEKQERLARAKQELAALDLEIHYFEQLCGESSVEPDKAPRQDLTPAKVLEVLQECEACLERRRTVPLWYKVKSTFSYGLFEWGYYKNDTAVVVTYLQKLFYRIVRKKLAEEVEALQAFLDAADTAQKMDELTQVSLECLHAVLFERYGNRAERDIFENLWEAPESVLEEYPIVLSTTFSSRSSLGDVMYDYIIMDEASQVDLTTGVLALSCARNAVIVGDLKQLPNVIPIDMKKKCDEVFASYQLPAGYSYSDNSFLKSVSAVIPDVPQTLLREHYRCHPKIIGFCNQKFYNNELIVMTEDHGETDVLAVYRTVAGNHQRGHVNQRQIDVAVKEVLPTFSDTDSHNIGVIAPYKDQVCVMAETLAGSDIKVDTVHQFQGQEKDVIVLTTVDNKATDFSDDPYLLNVAISRAQKKLCLVVSGNEQPQDSNIQDLIAYIEYNNFAVTDSEICSVFDLLYQQYTAQRLEFLSKHKKVSKYDSENLMYAALTELLDRHPDAPFDVICHQSLRLLIRNTDKLTEEERRYAARPGAHVDFLIYNRISKVPVLAIEVDGFHYHRNGTTQAERDRLKNSIFKKSQLQLLRLPTNGSGEIEKIERVLFGTPCGVSH